MSTRKPSATARFINPPNILKQKVGTGGIDESLLDKSQNHIETADLDFTPFAQQFLADFSSLIKKAKATSDGALINKMVAPIMQIKANGGMFRYQLLSDVADICLQFLEEIKTLDKDSLDVIEAHERTLQIILKHKLKGSGGAEGYALVKELDKACRRYFKKHKKPAKPGKK